MSMQIEEAGIPAGRQCVADSFPYVGLLLIGVVGPEATQNAEVENLE